MLLDRGDAAQAERAARRAVQLDPTLPPARINLALSLMLQDDLDGALESAQHAARLDPASAAAWDTLGCALRAIGCVEDALDAFAAAIHANPGLESAWSNLLFTIPCCDSLAPDELLRKASLWGGRLRGVRPLPSRRGQGSRLRVGFLSPDFRNHPVGRFIEPAFRLLDRGRFEVVAYSVSGRVDDQTERLRSLADLWRDASGIGDEELARLVWEDRLDVLVDLAGHTAGNRLAALARRPAPVLATYLGFPGTTGLPQMDALLADPSIAPPSDSRLFSEQVLRLEAPFLCGSPDEAPPAGGKAPAGPPRALVLANPAKVSESAVRCWAQLCDDVPDLQVRFLYGSWRSQTALHRMRTLFAQAGGDPARLVFQHWKGRADYLRQVAEADVVLDAFPYTGATTTFDALSTGTPVVTLEGPGYARRMSAALLRWAGFGSEVADGPAAYRARAARLLEAARGEGRRRRAEQFRDSALCRPADWSRAFGRALEALADKGAERP